MRPCRSIFTLKILKSQKRPNELITVKPINLFTCYNAEASKGQTCLGPNDIVKAKQGAGPIVNSDRPSGNVKKCSNYAEQTVLKRVNICTKIMVCLVIRLWRLFNTNICCLNEVVSSV